MATLVLLAVAVGCGGESSTGVEGGLVPGTYSASFTVPVSSQTPGALIGDHEFTFRVDDVSDASSFELLSSRHRSYTFAGEPLEWESNYLLPSTDRVIAGEFQWRVQWEYRDFSSLAVNVTMVEEGDGYELRFCRGKRGLENYPAHNCQAQRVN